MTKRVHIRIENIKAGDIFYEDASGSMMRCEALETTRSDEQGHSLRALTPLGERELYEAKGGRPVRLYKEIPSPGGEGGALG